MSRPRQQPYLGPRGQQGTSSGLPHHSWGLAGLGGVMSHKPHKRGPGCSIRLSSEETPCSSRSALTGGMQPLPVPLRGGAWTRRPQEHPRPQERARRSPALWASAPQGTGSTKNLRRHSAASWRSDSPGLRGPWGQTATFFTKSHGCFQRAGRFKNKCTGCS